MVDRSFCPSRKNILRKILPLCLLVIAKVSAQPLDLKEALGIIDKFIKAKFLFLTQIYCCQYTSKLSLSSRNYIPKHSLQDIFKLQMTNLTWENFWKLLHHSLLYKPHWQDMAWGFSPQHTVSLKETDQVLYMKNFEDFEEASTEIVVDEAVTLKSLELEVDANNV